MKKIPSVHGPVSNDFQSSWSGIIREAEMSLLSLIVLNYRDKNYETLQQCYDTLSGLRTIIKKGSMVRIKSDIYKHYTELETRRFKKAKMLCDENNITFDTDVFNLLKTRNHCDDLLFSTEDLEEDLGDDSEVTEGGQVAEVIEEEVPSNDDDGRLCLRECCESFA